MSKSCAYYSETIDPYERSLDNLVMAKKLFDLGKQLPGNYVFTLDQVNDRHDSFFLFALEILIGSETEIHEDHGDDFTFTIEVDFVKRWKRIEAVYPEASEDREWICTPITEDDNSDYSEYCYLEVEMELTDSGFLFHIEGTGNFYMIFEKICSCYERLQAKVAEWEEKQEDCHVRTNSKRDNHSIARKREGQHEVSSCPAAV